MRFNRIIVFLLLLSAGLSAKAQVYRNNFDNGFTWYPPWTNLALVADSTQAEGGLVCLCDSTMEFGLGFVIEAGTLYPRKNINIKYSFLFRTEDTIPSASVIFSIDDANGNRYWQSYPLGGFVSDTSAWLQVSFDLNFPSDYMGEGRLTAYIWNREKENLWFEDALLEVTPWELEGYLGVRNEELGVRSEKWGMLTEYILDGDTISEYNPLLADSSYFIPNVAYCVVSGIDTTYVYNQIGNSLCLITRFQKDCRLLRQTLVVPFTDSTLTIYRRNMAVDTSLFQSEYYLDREGFKVGKGDHTVISYHQTGISSTQFDAENNIAYFNLDYWRDHPMIHYPMSDTLVDYFEDVSCRQVYDGMQWNHFITLYEGNDVPNLPRIMQIPYGYESGIIFTEHADWTNIRTHRAVLFGSEKVTKAKDATGGFVYYGIPVTKSVFYNNPDQVTNEAVSRGTFKELHSTIKTDREFKSLLKQLYKIGFDICLHTPEQYTTTQDNLQEALDYMQRHFKSTTWIDHGYNNGPEKNREDMVCDGLNRQSNYYAAHLWSSHGIKYLWNAYYEENSLNQWCFDNNMTQPYPGFGDALPNRQITVIPSSAFYTWCTPSTLDAPTNDDWDFYYCDQRLQRIVDNHDVHIIHMYPAWVWPGRTFWTYDADSTIVALPGMNRAFERIAKLRDEHKMLPMTVKTYLDYYTGLLDVDYEIVDEEHIRLFNNGNEVKGFTLLCPTPVRFEDNRYYEFRKSGDYYYIWFDLKANDNVMIRIVNN